ncbi:hypothetical protein E2C01_019693 [Portunus trituberculatus]|uniref:Uncharacterized protein n=1 Tax=Portunus trituberculatus TaxID=210409 RepID=A0A5B7DZJ0_PORTR|nr:hypothetical protein [Portunus trituberculatus]
MGCLGGYSYALTKEGTPGGTPSCAHFAEAAPDAAPAGGTLVSLGCEAPLLRYGENNFTIDPCGERAGDTGNRGAPRNARGWAGGPREDRSGQKRATSACRSAPCKTFAPGALMVHFHVCKSPRRGLSDDMA